MSYRLLATTCVDGDCPSIHTDDPTGDFILRSRDATNPEVERDIRYTAAEMAELRRQMGW